jgi:hypothetical protein
MRIDTSTINNIVINTQNHSVDVVRFCNFLDKSPHIQQIAFVGKAIFDTPNFISILEACVAHDIFVIFGEVGPTTYENIYALVQFGNVIAVNIHENDPNLQTLLELKEKFNTPYPEVNIIVMGEPHIPQDSLSNTSYAFYNLADDIESIACKNLITEPMLNYDGGLIGCWHNTNHKHPINAFDLGIDRAINHKKYKRIIRMLQTHKICMECPCARCPVFASMIWANKKCKLLKS